MSWHYWLAGAMVLWGCAYFVVKLAFNSGVPGGALSVLQTSGMVLVAGLTTSAGAVTGIPSIPPLALFLTVLSGAMLSYGGYCFNVASQMPGSQMSVMTAAASQYPIITLLLCAVFLGEAITFYKVLGMAFGIASMLCFLWG